MMAARESDIDVLDPRFPVELTAPPHISTAILRDASLTWKDGPAFVADETLRTVEQAARQEERFIQPLPRFVPALAHEATAADMGLPAGWWRDTPAREGMPQPGDTDTVIAVILRAEADEAGAQERRPVRRVARVIARAAAALRQQPPAGGEL